MRHPLTDQYRNDRLQLIQLGRSLTESDGRVMTGACPAWSIKDVFAHLAGISTDIVAGNTDEAATPAWADRHVADRQDRSLAQVLDEWAKAGAEVSSVMEAVGEAFPLQLFVDQWTHEWDIRAAIGPDAEASADMTVFEHYFDDIAQILANNQEGQSLDELTVDVEGRRFDIGTGPSLGELSLTMFEFARLAMGRRSRRQLLALPWPMAEVDAHIDVLVVWSVSEIDVHDPLIEV